MELQFWKQIIFGQFFHFRKNCNIWSLKKVTWECIFGEGILPFLPPNPPSPPPPHPLPPKQRSIHPGASTNLKNSLILPPPPADNGQKICEKMLIVVWRRRGRRGGQGHRCSPLLIKKLRHFKSPWKTYLRKILKCYFSSARYTVRKQSAKN